MSAPAGGGRRQVPWAEAVEILARDLGLASAEAEARLEDWLERARPVQRLEGRPPQRRYRSRAENVDVAFTLDDAGQIRGVLLRTRYSRPSGGRGEVNTRVPIPADLAEAATARAQRLGCSRNEVILGALRQLLEGDDLEAAIERVVDELAARGREDLAAAVAIATDNRSPEERARSAARLLRVIREG